MPLSLSSLDLYSGAASIAAGGLQTFTATTGLTGILTIPAGRTFVGSVIVSCACTNAGANAVAAQATAVIGITGTGSNPANGNYARVDALAGANVAAGTVGDQGAATATIPIVASAPAGNSVQLTVQTTQAGTNSQVSVGALGVFI